MMKFILPVLLLMVASATAHAQPVYRCDDGLANVAYQDTPCDTGTAAPRDPNAPIPSLFELEAASPGDWEIGFASPRRTQAKQEGHAIALRVQERQKPLDERNAARHAQNRERCETALRIAERCGKNAGTFYCDARGFQPVAPEARPILAGKVDKYQMERCALEAARSD